MQTVRTHYDDFLGSVYSWILGDFETAQQKYRALFASLGMSNVDGEIAVDLGSGPGCQSLPLAELGYNVLDIDFCQDLIDELGQHAGDLPIRTVCDDLTAFRSHMTEPADLIVCMGDTLVHLPDLDTVDSVIRDVCESLKTGGTFIYAIRDYFDAVPQGAERFIPIRADDDRIFVCFLDYNDDAVHVHDILHRKIDGEWQTTISDYQKLRLDSQRIDSLLAEGGVRVLSKTFAHGMIVGVAARAR